MARSYNGWAASPDPDAIGINTAWEPIPGHRFPGGVKAGDVETVLTYVVRQLDKRVEPIDRDAIKDEWGWYYKASANSPDLISNHSSGTAFDYNATRHPNGVRGTFSRAQVAEIRKIQAEVDGVIRWLGDATRTADEMHFEVDATPAEVAAVAKRLRAPKPPIALPEDDMALIIKADGKPARLFAPPVFVPLDSGSAKNLRAAGVKEVIVTAGDYDEIRDQIIKALG